MILRALRILALCLAGLAGLGAAAGGAQAQESAPAPTQTDAIPPPLVAPAPSGPSNVVSRGTTVAGSDVAGAKGGPPDFEAWERLASRVEAALELSETTDVSLSLLRAQLTEWREVLLAGQAANADRIATLRDQIAALGPPPGEGETEAPEIAVRRTELNDQLVRLQAPGIAAVEGYRRADGLIREIDRTLRERQTSELLQIWPAPANPANWPEGLKSLSETVGAVVSETHDLLRKPEVRQTALDNLPAIAGLAAVGLFLLLRSRRLIERWTLRLQQGSGPNLKRLFAFVLSLGQFVMPALGVVLLLAAAQRSGFFGVLGTTVLGTFGVAVMVAFIAAWLGNWVFPRVPLGGRTLRMTDAQRAEGRWLTTAMGLVVGVNLIVTEATNEVASSEAAIAVLKFPMILAGGFLLFRMGGLLHSQFHQSLGGDEKGAYFDGVLSILSRGISVLGVVAPLGAAIGYVAAATAVIFPAAQSLALLGLLVLLQRLVVEIYAALMRDEEAAREALVPVLVGFGLVVVSLPLFALIWGARWSDITELWTKFQEGFQLGETRVSPADFVYFAVVFALCYTVTRLLQGALRGTILPRTALDQGGQNAVVSGVGYLGIFLSALVAINTTGIDLSGLAIVAGALSVGIGFGLQTIVANFVSGIILLVERPVSEGDWIEVGGVQGTVKSISVRSTRIQTFDRSDVIVPNQDLIAGRVTNWTRFNLSGRLIVPVGVAYGSDTRKVERILREIAEAQPMALLNPPPMIAFMGLGADSLNFEIRVILRDVNFSLAVRTEINHQILERFEAEGIHIPFSQQEVTLLNAQELGAALRGAPPAAAPPALPEAGPRPAVMHPHPVEREHGAGLHAPHDDDPDAEETR